MVLSNHLELGMLKLIPICLQGFVRSSAESTLYIKSTNDMFLVIVLYVDDMLHTGPQEDHIAAFKAELQQAFDMSDLGPLHYYLGIQFM